MIGVFYANFPALEVIMMSFILIGVSLTLASFAGLQFFYLFYLERVSNEHKKRIRELEHHCKYLSKRLNEAESQLVEQNELLETFYDEFEDEDEEVWADVIDER